MSLRSIRLAAVLMPAALLLHEGAYALHGGGSLSGAHGYLELALPLLSALAVSLAVASVVLHALGAPGEQPSPAAPLVFAGALVAVFAGQELIEAVLLGGGVEGLLASFSVAWLTPPLALVLGALASALIVSLERVGETLARRRRRTPSFHPTAARATDPGSAVVVTPACAGLSFGFARRPPPTRPAIAI